MNSRRFAAHPSDHRFFSTMAVLSAVTILVGFASTYGPKVLGGAPALPAIIHLHAVVFTAWLVVFVTQTTLILTKRTAIHRRLGVAAVGLAALMLGLGAQTAITVARLGHRGIPGLEFPEPEGFLLLNLAAIGVFAVLFAAGFFFRRDAQAHKRLMLMALLGGLLGPGVSRLPGISGRLPLIAGVTLAFLFAVPAYDLWTRRRVHWASMAGVVLALATVPPVVAQVAATGAWHTLAAWLLTP